jgi:hypothetical protein
MKNKYEHVVNFSEDDLIPLQRKLWKDLTDLKLIIEWSSEYQQRFHHTWDVIKRTQESIEEYNKRK